MTTLITKPKVLSIATKTTDNISITQKGGSIYTITTTKFNVNNTTIDSIGNVSIDGYIRLPNLNLSRIPSNTFNKLYSKLNDDSDNEIYWENKPILIQDSDIIVASVDISSRNLSVGGVDYIWPVDNGLHSQVLTTDGQGALIWSDANTIQNSLSNLNDTNIDDVTTGDLIKIQSVDGFLKWVNTKSLDDLTINNTIIGNTTPSTGTFTTLTTSLANITGTLTVNDDIIASNDLILTGDLIVESMTSLSDTLDVDGAVTLASTLVVSGTTGMTNLNVSETITGNVTGDLTGSVLTPIQPNITSLGNLTSLMLDGDVTISSSIDVNLLDNNSSAISFNTPGKNNIININTTTDSEGVIMSGSLDVIGSVTISGFTFPSSDGDNGQVLRTDGSGNLTWKYDSSYGAITILNDGDNRLITASGDGFLSGEANLTFDNSTLIITGSETISSTLTVTGEANLNGGLTIDTNKFSVDSSSGDTAISGKLNVDGLSNLNGGINVNINKFTVNSSGVIDEGTWNGNTINVAYGGTGTSSLTSNSILIGNGTSSIISNNNLTFDGSTLTVTGDLSISEGIKDNNGNEVIIISNTNNAINEITVANSSTGNNPIISASGDDINIGLNFQSKGTGTYDFLATSDKSTELVLYENVNNGSNTITIKSPDTITSNITLTLPNGTGTDGQLLKTDGNGNLRWENINVFTQYAVLKESSSTTGGSVSTGWTTRSLNNESDPDHIVTLSSDQFSLAPGKYYIEEVTTAYKTNYHQTRIKNITDDTEPIIGTSIIASDAYNQSGNSILRGIIEINDTKTFELQHYNETTNSNDNESGVDTNSGQDNIHAQLTICKYNSTGTIEMNNNKIIGVEAIEFKEDEGNQTITMKTPSISNNFTLTLPDSVPNNSSGMDDIYGNTLTSDTNGNMMFGFPMLPICVFHERNDGNALRMNHGGNTWYQRLLNMTDTNNTNNIATLTEGRFKITSTGKYLVHAYVSVGDIGINKLGIMKTTGQTSSRTLVLEGMTTHGKDSDNDISINSQLTGIISATSNDEYELMQLISTNGSAGSSGIDGSWLGSGDIYYKNNSTYTDSNLTAPFGINIGSSGNYENIHATLILVRIA
jgi:phage baseplate assembly protein gpV